VPTGPSKMSNALCIITDSESRYELASLSVCYA
jgi:hypothetical protein